MREAQQVKGSWWSPRRQARPIPGAAGPLERHQTSLLRVDRQAVFLKALGQHVHHPSGIFLTGKAHDEVVRVADQERAPLEARLDLPLEPFVQHVVQEDVREDRADHPALRRPRFRMRDASVFEDARIEPFADQSQQHPIPHPTLEKVAEVAVVYAFTPWSTIVRWRNFRACESFTLLHVSW